MAEMRMGVIIVDHGSRSAEANGLVQEVAAAFARRFAARYEIVEPAHMEIAEPSIATAYARCVERGARRIIVVPYFLGPGKHWTEDIPRLTAQAAGGFPGTCYHIAPCLGPDEKLVELLEKRIDSVAGTM